MKILHLALQAPYNEGWGYQENLLTKYQVRLGHDVTLVTTCTMNSTDSKIISCEPEDYVSPDGFRVIRLKYKRILTKRISGLLQIFPIFNLIKDIAPEFIMVHGLGNFSVLQVKKYIKKINPNCTVIADNHLDYNIGAHLCKKKFSTTVLRKLLFLMNKSVQNIYSKVYGVTPWRCEYANKIFGIADEKLDVLPAGADDEKIKHENRASIRKDICEKYNINENDFLIITGGKIDEKKNIHKLMEAVSKVDVNNICLLVFGNCSEDIKPTVERLAEHPNIKYIGWISSDDTYNYFLAADLMFFPGQHSVMWEQACACGTPCVFKHYHAMHHCDIGGNCVFLYDDSTEGIIELLKEVLQNDKYQSLLNVARSEKREQFLYSKLAEKSIETYRGNLK